MRGIWASLAGLAAVIAAGGACADHRHEGRHDAPPAARSAPPTPYGQPWRRGAYLPQEHWRSAVPTPGRFHLRPAPYGYHWVVVGRDAYLIQTATGLVVEAAPGAVD